MKLKISDLTKSLFFSFLAYMLFLAAVIGFDTFSKGDFDPGRAIVVSVLYLGALSVFFVIMLIVFKVKLGPS